MSSSYRPAQPFLVVAAPVPDLVGGSRPLPGSTKVFAPRAKQGRVPSKMAALVVLRSTSTGVTLGYRPPRDLIYPGRTTAYEVRTGGGTIVRGETFLPTLVA